MRGMISMRTAIESRIQVAADQRFALEADRARAAERRALREQLAQEFEAQVAGIVDSVAVTVDSLKNTAANLVRSAASTTRCSSDASVFAEATKDSASRIAGFSAQLSVAALSVRKNAEQSKVRAVLGVQEATAARAEMDLLAAASGQIRSIAELISGVTRQTNLLAINARIEAAARG
jgi:methyl-accepting chemotaxis protein